MFQTMSERGDKAVAITIEWLGSFTSMNNFVSPHFMVYWK